MSWRSNYCCRFRVTFLPFFPSFSSLPSLLLSLTDLFMVVQCRVAKRAIFQGTASMLFPMITIHTVVAQVGKVISKSKLKPGLVRTWGASAVGLLCIPCMYFLPSFLLPSSLHTLKNWMRLTIFVLMNFSSTLRIWWTSRTYSW